MWNDADGYEAYVGHWSRALAPRFVTWLALPTGLTWLDVACGTGALTAAILAQREPKEVVGVDSSAEYLASAQANCLGPQSRFITGDAHVLPFPSSSFSVAVSGLALNFISSERALAEQHRVVHPGGTIAAYVWDYAGEYEFVRRLWDAAVRLDPRAVAYDPGRKSTICSQQNLHEALREAGCTEIETCAFDDFGTFPSREAYWHAFDGRQGSSAEYLSLLTDQERLRLRHAVLSALPSEGPVKLKVRALAVKGIRE
jgi:ubiquinone/menaquinone biosynthesis C-methylase UbiE